MAKLTQRQAWQQLANEFREIVKTGYYSGFGICRRLMVMRCQDDISTKVYHAMEDKVHKELDGRVFLANYDIDGAKVRLKFCRARARD